MMDFVMSSLLWGSVGFLIFAALTSWRNKRKRHKLFLEQIEIRNTQRRHAEWERIEIARKQCEKELESRGIPVELIEGVLDGMLFKKGIR